MDEITVIGDVHGKVMPYLDIVQNAEYTVQLGDLGFKDTYKAITKHAKIRSINMLNHKFVPGNHDDYYNLPEYSLGHYGPRIINGVKFFIVRGARSVDQYNRIQGVSWWPNEELNHVQQNECYDLWVKEKPEIVITHDCPNQMYMYVLNNSAKQYGSATSKFLSALFEMHKPKLWLFGHHHHSISRVIGGTKFVCLDELEVKVIGNYT
jgi:predicted phosphodiesterase